MTTYDKLVYRFIGPLLLIDFLSGWVFIAAKMAEIDKQENDVIVRHAYEAGHGAGIIGVPVEACPMDEPELKAAWKRGWIAGFQDRQSHLQKANP